MSVSAAPQRRRKRRFWIWLAVACLVLAVGAGVVIVLVAAGGTDVVRQALVDECRYGSGTVYALPSPVLDEQIELAFADYEYLFVHPGRGSQDQDTPAGSHIGWNLMTDLRGGQCDSLSPVERLDGSPPFPDPAHPTSRPPFGWYLVTYSGGEGWVLFGSGEGAPYFSDDADTAQDAEIRERLSALPVATFPLGGGASDLAAALTDYSRVGHACTSPGATYRAERRVAITNLGTDVGPVSFGLGFGEHDGENVRIDRVVTIDLYRGLQPGESLEIGPLWGVKVVIDPEGSLGEPNTGNNTVSVPSETLVCS